MTLLHLKDQLFCCYGRGLASPSNPNSYGATDDGKVEEEKLDWTRPTPDESNCGISKNIHDLNGQAGGRGQLQSGWRN